VVRAGEAATADLMAALQPRLQRALSRAGPAYAISFCADTAQALTRNVGRASGGLEIKRTSSRYRNPANAPDEAESEALRHFREALAETGEIPRDHVQRTAHGEYRYYRPLVVQPLCLTCHGPVEGIPEEVRQILAERYPEDLATGYREGDLRGLVRVSVPEGRVRTPR
jgi:hypothetical protein